MVRPLKAAIVSSTKPLSFSVSVWIITWMSIRSATDRQQSIAAGVVPQSSCSFSAAAPARIRSEEHTSELQSLMRISYAVFCLTKKTQTNKIINNDIHHTHMYISHYI